MESTQKMEDSSKVEHLLSDKWVLWAHLPHDTDWSLKSYINIMELKSVEQTISLFNSVPEKMTKNCMLFLMRKDINPTWEDPKNCKGGCFSFKIPNKNVASIWKELSYCAVGETLTSDTKFQNCITGLTISPKKSFCIIKIWMSNLNFQNPRKIRKIKNLDKDGCIFKRHKSSF